MRSVPKRRTDIKIALSKMSRYVQHSLRNAYSTKKNKNEGKEVVAHVVRRRRERYVQDKPSRTNLSSDFFPRYPWQMYWYRPYSSADVCTQQEESKRSTESTNDRGFATQAGSWNQTPTSTIYNLTRYHSSTILNQTQPPKNFNLVVRGSYT